MRYIKIPFKVKVNSNTYYCFGYDTLNCYIKKVNSFNKYFKVYKVSAYHVVLSKHLLNKIYKEIRLFNRTYRSVKDSYYYDHYNIHKNRRRAHKVYRKELERHEKKFK